MDFNHISRKLTQEQVNELTKLYHTYHKQYWCYKKMFKKFKRMDLALKLSSVVFTTTGAVVGSVTLNPIFLGVCKWYRRSFTDNNDAEKFFQKN